jgi:hypothetical protein
MNDYVLSLIRTWTPIAVGAVLSWLAVKYGLALPESISNEVTVALTGVVIAAYYGIVRALEKRWPWFGKLLGAAKKPIYAEPPR